MDKAESSESFRHLLYFPHLATSSENKAPICLNLFTLYFVINPVFNPSLLTRKTRTNLELEHLNMPAVRNLHIKIENFQFHLGFLHNNHLSHLCTVVVTLRFLIQHFFLTNFN